MPFLRVGEHVLYYRWSTPRPDRTFVFVNSLGTDYRIWWDLADRLTGNVLLYDKRGHGLSDVVSETNGLNDYADDLVALLDSLEIASCVLVGLSVGGMIAQIVTDRVSRRIERLVLCDTGHRIGTAALWDERIRVVEEEGIASISESLLSLWFSKRFLREQPDQVAGYRNMLERTPSLGYIRACEAIRDADLTDVARRIDVPTMCVAGSEDRSTPPGAVRNLAHLIGGSRFEVIPEAGHLPCVDNPARLAALILEFIR